MTPTQLDAVITRLMALGQTPVLFQSTVEETDGLRGALRADPSGQLEYQGIPWGLTGLVGTLHVQSRSEMGLIHESAWAIQSNGTTVSAISAQTTAADLEVGLTQDRLQTAVNMVVRRNYVIQEITLAYSDWIRIRSSLVRVAVFQDIPVTTGGRAGIIHFRCVGPRPSALARDVFAEVSRHGVVQIQPETALPSPMILDRKLQEVRDHVRYEEHRAFMLVTGGTEGNHHGGAEWEEEWHLRCGYLGCSFEVTVLGSEVAASGRLDLCDAHGWAAFLESAKLTRPAIRVPFWDRLLSSEEDPFQ
jgi:hypothetical protein